MNLREFLQYKTSCPVCQNILKTFFCAKSSHQEHLIEKNKYIIKIPQRSVKHAILYKAAHVFDLDDGSYHVDFYSPQDKLLTTIPKKIHDNFYSRYMTNYCSLIRSCGDCQYYYISWFNLKLEDMKIDDFFVHHERFKVVAPFEDMYLHFIVQNNFADKRVRISYGKSLNNKDFPFDFKGSLYIENVILNFTNHQDMVIKLKNYIVFS